MYKLKNYSERLGWTYSVKENFPGTNKLLNFVIVLLPSWSSKDLSILELISDSIKLFNVPVYVLDIDEFKTQNEISDLIPGLTGIYQTPVVALYENGVMQKYAQGESIQQFTESTS